jgi:hypothetical protein
MQREEAKPWYPAEKEGALKKKGHFFRNWKERWFVLAESNLYYFAAKPDNVNRRIYFI